MRSKRHSCLTMALLSATLSCCKPLSIREARGLPYVARFLHISLTESLTVGSCCRFRFGSVALRSGVHKDLACTSHALITHC